MKQLGFAAQRPLRRAYEQDAHLVQNWKRQPLPALRQRAKARGTRLFFADEASMCSDYQAGTTWAPQGQRPIVGASGQRHSVNMLSVISAQGQLQFMLIEAAAMRKYSKDF